ncbi:co-chaperone GroES [bacterium]|nr:co-chaperone GroES [bacterium]
MNFRPLYDKVLVQRIEAEQKTKSGLFIPDTAKEKPLEGKVISVGAGKRADDGRELPLTVKVGDHILFGKYAGTEIKIDGQEYLLMKEDEILGIIG